MEGIPRVPMIAPEMKVPDVPMPQELVPKLREYILTHFNDDPTKFNEAFSELQTMRYTICRCQADVECLCVMKRYYAQMTMMKSRFPMEPGEPVAVPFGWSDRSDMPNSVFYEDVNFELCCVMFNIAAAHATIGVNETRSDMDSIKNAFMHFQCAAWPLQQLRDELGASKFGSADFEPDFLTFFIKIMLAQGQECLIEKSMIDHRKNTVVAKLAAFASETYFELKVLVDHASISEYISNSKVKSWKILCGAKGNLYAAISRMYLGQQSDEDKKYGERLAHYAAALDHIKEGQKMIEKDKRESLKQAMQFAFEVISQKEANARKENDFIYHERVPKSSDLSQVEAVAMVKPIGFDPCDRSVSGDDLFAALLPANVLKGVSLYSEEKAKLKRKMIEKIEKKDTELEQHLLALQLNQINLDQVVDDMRLPEELLQASASYTSQPHGFSDLLEKLTLLASKSSEAEFKLNDLKRRLENIKCPQLEEDEGYRTIVNKVSELLDHHSQARINNMELQKALASQSEELKVLALPLMELAKRICDKSVNASGTPEGIALRKMVDKVDEMKRQRMALFEALRIDLENDDITSKILAEKDFNMSVLFDNELRKHEKSTKLLEMNMNAQENILKALTEANANFAECRREIVENNEKRIQQSVELVTAHQVFTGVREKTEAANVFFNQLFSLIRKLDIAIMGMEGTFKGEKEKHEEQIRIAAERAQQLKEKMSLENPMELGGFSRERSGRPRLVDYMEYYRNKKGGSPSIQTPPFSSMNSSPIPTNLGPNGPNFNVGGGNPSLSRNMQFNSQEQLIPQSNFSMLNQSPQMGHNFPQQFPMNPLTKTTTVLGQEKNGINPGLPQSQHPKPQIPFSSQNQHVPQSTVSMMSQPNQMGFQQQPPMNSSGRQQNGMSPVFLQNQPQIPQAPFTSQDQSISQRSQINPDFSQSSQSLGQFSNSGSESTLSSKDQPVPQNPSPLLNQPPQQRPQVNPGFLQMPQNTGFLQLQPNSQSPQNQNPVPQNIPTSTGFSNFPNGFQPQGQFPNFIPPNMPQKQEISTTNTNNVSPSFLPVTSVSNQQHNNFPEVSSNQGFMNQQSNSVKLSNFPPTTTTVNSNQEKNGFNSGFPQHQSPQNPFNPNDLLNSQNTVPMGNNQQIQKPQGSNFPQQFLTKSSTMNNDPNQQHNIGVPGFSQSQSPNSVNSQPVSSGNNGSNFVPGNMNHIPLPNSNLISTSNNHQEPPKTQNFVNQQVLPLKPSNSPMTPTLNQQNRMGSGLPHNQPVPQSTMSMMNQPSQMGFQQQQPPLTNGSGQQHNGMGSVFLQNQHQVPFTSQDQSFPQNTVSMMSQQKPQTNPNFPTKSPVTVNHQNSTGPGYPQGQPQGSQAPFASNPVSGAPDLVKPVNNDVPNQQKYGIAPSPYAGYASKKNPSTTVLKDSPWHKNVHQLPTSGTQSGYISPFSPQSQKPNSNFQPIQQNRSPMNNLFSENNQVNQEVKKEDGKAKDPTQELLDNLFGPPKPLNFPKPSTGVPIQPVTPMVLQDPPRPAATVLPIRRPDGSWTGESSSNTILSFTNVQSVSHSDTEGRNSRAGI